MILVKITMQLFNLIFRHNREDENSSQK